MIDLQSSCSIVGFRYSLDTLDTFIQDSKQPPLSNPHLLPAQKGAFTDG